MKAISALAAFFAFTAPVLAQIPQPAPSPFQTVEDADEARTRAAAEDQTVVVINDRGNDRVLAAKQMDEFVALSILRHAVNDCDSSAANKFCKDRGMLMSYGFDTAPMPKTWVPGTGRTCEAAIPGQCVAFTKISCRS